MGNYASRQNDAAIASRNKVRNFLSNFFQVQISSEKKSITYFKHLNVKAVQLWNFTFQFVLKVLPQIKCARL